MLWLLVLLRGVLEMVFWLLIGRWLLAMLAGLSANENGVVRLFDFLLRPVRCVSGHLWPGRRSQVRDVFSLCLVLVVWLVCGFMKAWA